MKEESPFNCTAGRAGIVCESTIAGSRAVEERYNASSWVVRRAAVVSEVAIACGRAI